MLIQCTKKLLDQLKIKPELNIEEELLYSWHATIKNTFGKEAVVLVNNKNRYVVVISKHERYEGLKEHIKIAIKETLKAEGIAEHVVEKYLFGGIKFSKTKNQSMIAKMLKACEPLNYYKELMEDDLIYNVHMSLKASQYTYYDGDKYVEPSGEMKKDLSLI